MPNIELPLIGLLEETILPGEERQVSAPALDAGTLAALSGRPVERLVAVTITSPVELPALVSGRWATECVVVSVEMEKLVLRGVRRVRVVQARGQTGPYVAELEVEGAVNGSEAITGMVEGGHALFAALAAGAVPARPDWQARLLAALPQLHRAVATDDELRDAMRRPAVEALAQHARGLAAHTKGVEKSCELEEGMRAIAAQPELSPSLRRRLWSQVVEVQKRLDLYDPDVTLLEGDDVGRLQRRLMQAGLPKAARETAKRELRLLRNMEAKHHDYAAYVGHLDFMARLPWHPDPPAAGGEQSAIGRVRQALDVEHAGLDKAKRRVLEYLAVRELGGESASLVLCLAGPPGVGKTSIARAIAGALSRKFVRVAMGGVHDESEIRGHRLSFTAAAPGRILDGIARAGSASAVVLLDEIDKIGKDPQRSPSAALLEVLDPEQNTHFQDNYLGVPYDLSNALFIATANELSDINPVLLDRLEVVELEGYTVADKEVIARKHLIERARVQHGLPEPLRFDDEVLRLVIESHTREAGVRQLSRALSAIHRGRALALVEERTASAGATRAKKQAAKPVTADEVRGALGVGRQPRALRAEALPVGVATALSVGADGGSLLFIEVGRLPGTGKVRLTGRLGVVMRESARAALAHLRMDPERYGTTAEALGGDFHVHVPEGATPKDGPSAGAALMAAFLSAATGIPLRADVALTGELTLSGRVLPVGGVRAKLLAADRAGIRRVLVPADNRGDAPAATEMSAEAVFVSDAAQVIEELFTRSPLLAARARQDSAHSDRRGEPRARAAGERPNPKKKRSPSGGTPSNPAAR